MPKIENIFDYPYGCEERSDDELLKVIVSLDNGEEITVADRFLRDNNLDEGSEWTLVLSDSAQTKNQ